MTPIYDKIGATYNKTRRADPRMVDRIVKLLDLPEGSRILDVGAGTGSYSRALADRGYRVTALEPSQVMSNQAADAGGVAWVRGAAESLPFVEGTFDASILILCIHHFTDAQAALGEIRRVTGSGPILIFTYDPEVIEKPWLFEYFPVFRTQIRRSFPSIEEIRSFLGGDEELLSIPFYLPHDLADGFAGAAWRYPERYLDQDFRNGTSAFQMIDPRDCQQGLDALSADLRSGIWDSRHGVLRSLDEYDHGYTFILTKGGPGGDATFATLHASPRHSAEERP